MSQESPSQQGDIPPQATHGPCLPSRPRAQLGSAGPHPSDGSGAGWEGVQAALGWGPRPRGAEPAGPAHAAQWSCRAQPAALPPPPSARRSTRCCALTSHAGASAPAAPSARCRTAARSASAGGPPPPRSPAARPPGARPPPATDPGDRASGGCVRKPRGWAGSSPSLLLRYSRYSVPLPALTASDPKRNLSSRSSIMSPPEGPQPTPPGGQS